MNLPKDPVMLLSVVNTQLRDKVQKTLEEMAKDGSLAKISTKWFGSDITTIGK